MKQIVFLAFFIVLLSCSKEATNQSKHSQVRNYEVHKLMQEWANGMIENDPLVIDNVLHDTWIYSGPDDGSTTDKAKALEAMTPGNTTLKQIILKDTIIRIYNNVAVVTGKEELVFAENKDTKRVFLRFTDVFLKKNGKVSAISTHSSTIKKSLP